MKTVSLVAVVMLCSACGTQISDKLGPYNAASLDQDSINASRVEIVKQWGADASWQTTPDGYPVW